MDTRITGCGASLEIMSDVVVIHRTNVNIQQDLYVLP